MPDVLLYFKASLLTTIASMFLVLAFVVLWGKRSHILPGTDAFELRARKSTSSKTDARPGHEQEFASACVLRDQKSKSPLASTLPPQFLLLSAAAGILAGYWMLHVEWSWPPISAMDRFRELILPAIGFVEFVACWRAVPRWLALVLRSVVALTIGSVLMHGSIYLPHGSQITWQTIGILAITQLSLILLWLLLAKLAIKRSAGAIHISLAISILCSGIIIMLGGYVNGGAAAIPLGCAVMSVVGATRIVSRATDMRSIVGFGVVSLFGLLFVGRYFGGISSTQAFVVFFAPALCWGSELPVIRSWGDRTIGLLRILLVSIPLLIVLLLAKAEFDRRMVPLISSSETRLHR